MVRMKVFIVDKGEYQEPSWGDYHGYFSEKRQGEEQTWASVCQEKP